MHTEACRFGYLRRFLSRLSLSFTWRPGRPRPRLQTYTLAETARILGLSKHTLSQWRSTGKNSAELPIHRAGDGTLHCHKSDVDRFKRQYRPGKDATSCGA